MIELAEGIWINSEAVTMIKAIDEKSCALWVTGQSALDGFVLEYPAGEVAEVINDALENVEYEDEEE